jgi:hypothetical protein
VCRSFRQGNEPCATPSGRHQTTSGTCDTPETHLTLERSLQPAQRIIAPVREEMDWAERVSREDGETGGVNLPGTLRERNAARKERCAKGTLRDGFDDAARKRRTQLRTAFSAGFHVRTARRHDRGASLARYFTRSIPGSGQRGRCGGRTPRSCAPAPSGGWCGPSRPRPGPPVPLAVQGDDAVGELGTEVICDEEEIFSAVVRLMNTGVTK